MDVRTFRGGPAEVGRAQGLVDPEYVRGEMKSRLERPHNFEHPYFQKNLAFMRREFPDLVEQMEAFGAAVGEDDFDHTYFLHLFNTGRGEDACSAFGILLAKGGPAYLRTVDPTSASKAKDHLRDKFMAVFPDLKPHGFIGQGSRTHVTVGTSVNDAGLMLGGASGHPKFNWPDNPEHVNLYFTLHLLNQHCADCEDVRKFLMEYRISGVKGITGTAVDAKGNLLGFELESENIAFREPEDGFVLEVNHWQHPDLQGPARAARPDWWQSPYYYNSQNRVLYADYYREILSGMSTLEELIDFSFDVQAPGRILQMEGHNIANWATSQAYFMTARDRKIRAYEYPLEKDRYADVVYPG